MNSRELPATCSRTEDGFNEFCLSLVLSLGSFFPKGTQIESIRLFKNNDNPYDSISIRESGVNTTPAIPIAPYYEQFLDGTDLETIVKTVIEDYGKAGKGMSFDTSNLCNYEWIKKRLGFKLVNYEKNEETLKNVPHAPFLDLAIVIFVDVADMVGVPSTFRVCNNHMRVWNIEADQLIKEAMENMACKIPAGLHTMTEILDKFTDGGNTDDLKPSMYVLTNESQSLGAGCILYHGMLQTCAEKVGKEFYLLPSSIHEMILIPCDQVDDPGELIRMVRDINRSVVSPPERLSDHIYKYDRETNILSMLDIENEYTEHEEVTTCSKISLMTQMDGVLSRKGTNSDRRNAITQKEEH